jgi:lantibiotic biosynthesis protein
MPDRAAPIGWKARVRPGGFFVLRTPRLALDELARLGDGLTASNAAPAQRAEAIAADRATVRARLLALAARPEIDEAIGIASPSLHAALAAWREAPGDAGHAAAEEALLRYASRMSARATPFGLFAGQGVGTIGKRIQLQLAGPDAERRRTRLDAEYLWALSAELARVPAIAAELRYRPSSSLYRIGDRLRFTATRLDAGRRTFQLSAVETGEHVEAAVAAARSGATREELVAALGAVDPDVDPAELAPFVDGLIDAQVLVNDLEPHGTGCDPLDELCRRTTGELAATLHDVRARLAALDEAGVNPPARYRELEAVLERLPGERARVLQVDLIRPAPDLELPRGIADELVAAAQLLRRLRPPEDPLAAFRAAFVTRYERARVPLALVLDEDAGIGLGAPAGDGSPLLAGLGPWEVPAARERRWDPLDDLLLDRLAHALHAGAREITLGAEDLAALPDPDGDPPDAFAVLATLFAPAAGGPRAYLGTVIGASGLQLFGRFCDADPALAAAMRAHLAAEEALRPDAIFAEVVHLPPGRLGNVTWRPVLRRFELPYLGRSGAPVEQQLAIGELSVTVIGERVVLWSDRHAREVIPRLTHAHAFQAPGNLDAYRFFGALSDHAGGAFWRWSWGALEGAPILPRVRHGRTVLSPARWRLAAREVDALTQVTGAARFERVQALRARLDLPRRVVLVERDQELPIDLDSAPSIDAALAAARRRELVLRELVADLGPPVVAGPGGAYAHEVIIPYVRTERPRQATAIGPSAPRPGDPRRTVAPGAGWATAYIYAGSGSTDRVLLETIAPLVDELRATGAIERWFFLRHGDPHHHLRVRFGGPPERLDADVVPRLREALVAPLADGRIWRWTLATYERELERYGGLAAMTVAEDLFCADSDAVISILCACEVEGDDLRWRAAVAGIDRWLADLGIARSARGPLVGRWAADFAAEIEGDAARLGARYRERRADLAALLEEPPARIAAALETRSIAIRDGREALRALAASGELDRPIDELVASHVHMFVNRLLRSEPRLHERVLYDFMARSYGPAR